MKKNVTQQLNQVTLVSLSAGLWIGYLLVLLVIDFLFYPQPVFPLSYYIINGLVALLVLGAVQWSRFRDWLGRVLLPLMIALLSIVPVVFTQSLLRQPRPPGPASGPESILLRTMPLLLIALILFVWEYGWRLSIIYNLVTALTSLGLQFAVHNLETIMMAPLVVVLIQIITFLLVGYFINALVQQLRERNASLAQANARLADHAATLEELAISHERNRMARELHDTLAHTLSALSVQLETAKAYLDVDPATTAQILDRSLAVTRGGLQDTRHALKALRANQLEDMGLALALRQLAVETTDRANLKLNLSLPTHLPMLPHAVEQCLYRITQEALTNVIYHANAQSVTVSLTFNGVITLQISDDGSGFDPQQIVTSGHYGLVGMRERAELVGGELTIASEPAVGTVIQLVIKDYER